MSPQMIRDALCRLSSPEAVYDAVEWWNQGSKYQNTTGINVAALCHSPRRIQQAISGCLDLWGRTSGRGYERTYRKNTTGEGGGLQLVELPAMIAEQQEHFLFAKLSKVHELLEDEGNRRFMRTRRRLLLRPAPW